MNPGDREVDWYIRSNRFISHQTQALGAERHFRDTLSPALTGLITALQSQKKSDVKIVECKAALTSALYNVSPLAWRAPSTGKTLLHLSIQSPGALTFLLENIAPEKDWYHRLMAPVVNDNSLAGVFRAFFTFHASPVSSYSVASLMYAKMNRAYWGALTIDTPDLFGDSALHTVMNEHEPHVVHNQPSTNKTAEQRHRAFALLYEAGASLSAQRRVSKDNVLHRVAQMEATPFLASILLCKMTKDMTYKAQEDFSRALIQKNAQGQTPLCIIMNKANTIMLNSILQVLELNKQLCSVMGTQMPGASMTFGEYAFNRSLLSPKHTSAVSSMRDHEVIQIESTPFVLNSLHQQDRGKHQSTRTMPEVSGNSELPTWRKMRI